MRIDQSDSTTTDTSLPVDDASDTAAVEPDADVCVLGLGHVGLPTALLAAQEHTVVGVDIDQSRVDAIERGDLPMDEPDIDQLYERVAADFSAQTTVADADVYVIVTPTPVDAERAVADVSYVEAAAEMIAPTLSPGDLVVLESTVPPGTTERLVAPTLETSGLSRSEFRLAFSPERASPGETLTEMVENSRVVGGIDEESVDAACAFYDSFVTGAVRRTVPRVAEFVKLVENTFRDVNIALANEFALVAEELGLDVHEAIDLANEHPRVGIHHPGPGVGGHCIPVDPNFLSQHTTRDRLVSLARDVNDSMPAHVVQGVEDLLDGDTDATVTLLGAAYKGGVGDTRRTPTRTLVDLLAGLGVDVRLHDPHVDSFPVDPEPLAEAVAGSDCLVLVTDHSEYTALDPSELGEVMATKNLYDTRGLLDTPSWEAAGFEVAVLGDGRTQE
ncbi:nucleotide sugar dehydrogenase [Haloarchaeobius sp. DFWS5]|uniref:nucleotide sugar dehydrogenase n=1 Tax=Haloarchaeobius sp. DFWS5 TaxID=3446114 RepID=UPI003EB84D57